MLSLDAQAILIPGRASMGNRAKKELSKSSRSAVESVHIRMVPEESGAQAVLIGHPDPPSLLLCGDKVGGALSKFPGLPMLLGMPFGASAKSILSIGGIPSLLDRLRLKEARRGI